MHRKINLWFIFFSAFLLVSFIFQPISFSQEERKLHIAIVGSIQNDDPQYDPFVICRPEEVQLLLLDMVESPMKKEEMESRLNSSKVKVDDLLRLEIIRQEGDLYYINFPLFTEKDEEIIMKVAEKYSKYLVKEILEKKDQIYSTFDDYKPSTVGKDKLAFIVVGFLSLDVGALGLLAQNNYIINNPEKPGGNHYVLNAEEVTEFSLKELYWGGHTDNMDNIMFLTFGDHYKETKRYAFPDILWSLGRSLTLEVPEFYKKELLILLNDQTNNLVINIGNVLSILKASPIPFAKIQEASSLSKEELQHILDFLLKINYLTEHNNEYSLAVPVFDETDEKMMREVQAIVHKEILSWMETYYGQIKIDLKDISAVKMGVDYKETFNMLWHYFFGYTNKLLALSGFIYDTYKGPEGQRGYLPAVMPLNLAVSFFKK
jgi:hypothetical protein